MPNKIIAAVNRGRQALESTSDAVMGLPAASSVAGRLSLRVMVCETGSEWVGPKHHRGTAMDYYAGIDVSLEQSSVCVVDAAGRIVCEAKVASEPEALVRSWRSARRR